ncbi:hypothetical protein [Chromobacterium violaceum]|uniref:Uncharacterized protein n=1 Tax=Chromobacterium violaceum TaxID=536 RepID=A0A202B2G4_CHRVL|nr:hypothetical protein [Chromobacterium violaceum]OVE45674.1 hypothetical protein CBW21_22030 [Chromobacterium violaceum]
MHPIDAVPYFFPLIRVGALLMIALVVGIFAASFVNHRMLLMDYPDQQRRRWRTLAFEVSTVAIVTLGAIVVFLPIP